MEHTIAALATPPGEGGLAVVRISGERAYEVAAAVFRPMAKGRSLAKAKGYTAMLGFLKRAAGCATKWWPCASARPKAIPARMW